VISTSGGMVGCPLNDYLFLFFIYFFHMYTLVLSCLLGKGSFTSQNDLELVR